MKTNNVIMGVLVAIIAVMGVAFAAFSTTLNINGTATIDSRWNVEFAPKVANDLISGCKSTVTKDNDNPSSATVTVDGLEATVNATMISPGDEVTCYIIASNTGDLDAVRKNFAVIQSPNVMVAGTDGQVQAYAVTVSPTGVGTTLTAKTGSEELTIVISYNINAQEAPSSSASFKAQAVYEQVV